ncbi:hypothetical protein D1Z90_12020 [Motilimonas pumila]|uniref:Transposase n=1 Tax=Motilimonas pumila TaxID=2303987 RepID=A0A418YDG1_9GAMM|nr:hypothetical protein D1Z90_12020 [Motilimonas pumila]
MTQKRADKRYSIEFKEEAVTLVREQGYITYGNEAKVWYYTMTEALNTRVSNIVSCYKRMACEPLWGMLELAGIML